MRLTLHMDIQEDGTVDMTWDDTCLETPTAAELKLFLTGALMFASDCGSPMLGYRSLVAFKQAREETVRNKAAIRESFYPVGHTELINAKLEGREPNLPSLADLVPTPEAGPASKTVSGPLPDPHKS